MAVNPIVRNLPQIIIYVIAAGVAIWFLLVPLIDGDDSESGVPEANSGEFAARQAAKVALVKSDPTATLAVCNSVGFDEDADAWNIECSLTRESGETETTRWQVKDGVATKVES